MRELVFMVEEPSMKEVLDVILPQILPLEEVCYLVLTHEGKSDLENSIPTKLRGWNRGMPSDFIIVRDQDSGNCIEIKNDLVKICEDNGRPDSLVRIVCHELESWFLGDLAAVGEAYQNPGLADQQRTSKFRQPDNLANAAQELARLVDDNTKKKRAERIAPCMAENLENKLKTSQRGN